MVTSAGAALKGTVNASSASVVVPAGALPEGTAVSLVGVANPAALERKMPAGQSYLVSFSVSWIAPDGTSPTSKASITLTVIDPAIRAGDTIYILTSHGLKVAGAASTNGTAKVTFTTDPDFVIANVPQLSVSVHHAAVKATAVRVEVNCGPRVRCTGVASVSLGTGRPGLSGVAARGALALVAGQTKTLVLGETIAGRLLLSSIKAAHPVAARLTVELVGGETRVYRLTLS
jgi:hypothetical protein